MQKLKLNKLIITAMLTAIEIVFSRFLSFTTQNVKIGFSFLPVVICAVALGPYYTVPLAAVSDIIGALLFPTGPYFPGFTLTAVISALIFSLILHKKFNFFTIIISVIITQILCSMLMNSVWLSVLYGSPFIPLLVTRAVQSLIMCIIEIITLTVLIKPIKRLLAYINK